jgi:phage baseplate assembly protein W
MANYAPKLPLTIDKIDGAYSLVRDLKELAKQNFKMLLLTEPGERVMIPQYGVGLKRKLFENLNNSLLVQIENLIREKTNFYLPYITITDINISVSDQFSNITEQAIEIKIYYNISSIKENDLLSIQL